MKIVQQKGLMMKTKIQISRKKKNVKNKNKNINSHIENRRETYITTTTTNELI